MKIVVAQLNPIVGALNQNTEKIVQEVEKARVLGAHLVLFPELSICGYPPQDLLYHHTFLEAINLSLERIAHSSFGLTVIVGVVRLSVSKGKKSLYNSAAIIRHGKIIGFQDKHLLPNYDVFDESRYFEPGHISRIWEIEGKKVGVTICEDIWKHGGYIDAYRYDEDPILALQSLHPDLVVNLSASPYHFQKPNIRIEICSKVSKTLGCPTILCCQVGANGQIIFDGYSIYVNKEGKLCHLAKGFCEDRMLVELHAKICPCSFTYNHMQDLLQALIMGVKDYFIKSDFTRACLGISGGIDSALVAYIAMKALGKENVLAVSMPSTYSSEGSKKDAKNLAKHFGIQYKEIPIDPLFFHFLDLLTPHFHQKNHGVTEENLQARIRGILLMALSNKHGYILLNTGNKSEIATGYSTLYGDMCGGLGVIADVMKTRVYDLCQYINESEGKEIIFKSIIERPPSAELSPSQVDLDSLPEYEIIDNVLQGYVEDYLSVGEIAEKYYIEKNLVFKIVKKIHDAEYKREQGPPILRVSKKSFGIGRRYPIVEGWM